MRCFTPSITEFAGSGYAGLRDFRHKPDLSPDQARRESSRGSALLRASKRRGQDAACVPRIAWLPCKGYVMAIDDCKQRPVERLRFARPGGMRTLSQQTYRNGPRDDLPGPGGFSSNHHPRTSCQGLMPRPHAKASCQDLMPRPHAKTSCQDLDLAQTAGDCRGKSALALPIALVFSEKIPLAAVRRANAEPAVTNLIVVLARIVSRRRQVEHLG
jgi:hypothetical protein